MTHPYEKLLGVIRHGLIDHLTSKYVHKLQRHHIFSARAVSSDKNSSQSPYVLVCIELWIG